MKKTNRKHTTEGLIVLVMTMLMLVSCMKTDEEEKTPQCAITYFSVGNITSSVLTKKYDASGNATDTMVSRTINGSDIPFNINQLTGHIHTVDSLPNWIDLTKVVPTFLSEGNVYGKVLAGDDLFYPLTAGSDSIDFSKTVELLCISTDGTTSKLYKVDIYKHVANTDTLEWKSVSSDLAISGESRTFHVDDSVFVFAQNDADETIVTFARSSDATTWSTPATIPVSLNSITLFQGNFYGLGADGYIYLANPAQLDAEWTKASDQKVERLLAADGFYLYAYNGHDIIGTTKDLTAWTEQGNTDLEMLPETSVNSFSYESKTNSELQVAVMTGISSHNSNNGVSWYKTSSIEESTNQPWAYIQVTPDNPFGLPHLEHLSVAYYQKSLFAIGTESGQYKKLYRSDDNGITWHPQTEKYLVPAELDAANGAASIVAVGKKLWIIQENGKVWQGSIQ